MAAAAVLTNAEAIEHSEAQIAQEFGLTVPIVRAVWDILIQDARREVEAARKEQVRGLIRTAVQSLSRWKKSRLRAQIATKIWAENPTPGIAYNPPWLTKVQHVYEVFLALGQRSAGDTVTIDAVLVRRVMPIAHRVPTICLQGLGFMNLPSDHVVHMSCHYEVQADMTRQLVEAFGYKVRIGNLHT